MTNKYIVLGLFLGKAETLINGQISAIRKKSVQSIDIRETHIINDEVVDQKFHGGDMRVIHHYSKINYDHLKTTFPDISNRFIPGSFGENLYTEELTEKDLFVGDTFQIGDVIMQVTVPRRPCATINNGYEDNRILKEVINSGHVGWFYKVIKEGIIHVGDEMILIDRPYPNLNLYKLFEQGYSAPRFSDLPFLKECLDTNLMDKGWMPKLSALEY